MEMLMLLCLAGSIFVAWLYPKKESLSFGFFLAGASICCLMFMIAVINAVIPFGTI
ncbi:MAG: hypothetical protein KH037_05245 [Burkholderiales bacterium]|nr:hypothetical protein [Burkholderiales bacterium]